MPMRCSIVSFAQDDAAEAVRRMVGLRRRQTTPASLQFAKAPADVVSKVALMRAIDPESFSEALGALSGERSFALNISQYGPPALLSDTSATAMALLSATQYTVHTRYAVGSDFSAGRNARLALSAVARSYTFAPEHNVAAAFILQRSSQRTLNATHHCPRSRMRFGPTSVLLVRLQAAVDGLPHRVSGS
jgi:hypothetical protein